MVCAGIVTYNPDINQLKKNIDSIISQVDNIIIADNGSQNINDIKMSLTDIPIIFIENESNLGVAAALNQLLCKAQDSGHEWILTLDDDSICSNNMVTTLLTALRYYDNIAVVSPVILDARTNFVTESVTVKSTIFNATSEFDEINMCITAGSLTNISAVLSNSGFNENLFIDHVDHEMCLRLKSLGYKIIKAHNAVIYQEFGASSKNKRFLWKTYTQRGYSPIRVYYQTRNSLFLVRKYGSLFDNRPRYFYLYLVFAFTARFIFEPKRLIRLKAFLKGYLDGLGKSILC